MTEYATNHASAMKTSNEKGSTEISEDTIVVIGTGDFGRALSAHLQKRGCNVIIGSRNPEKYRQQIPDMTLMETSEALKESDIVCLAIPVEGFGSLDVNLFANKIVIDVSNRIKVKSTSKLSQAESLQLHLTESEVVKAFNTISAYALQSGTFQGSKEVPICSNSSEALGRVSKLMRKLGFSPTEMGNLSNARAIEDIPMAFFEEWKKSLALALIYLVSVLILIVFRLDLCYYFEGEEFDKARLVTIPMYEFQHSLGHTALFLLTGCYLPGVIASYIQIYRGTKYSRFPKWLTNWMKMRKTMGRLAMLFAGYHAIMGVVLESDFWEFTFWRSHLFIFCGASGLTCIAVLAITSLPSVGATLTWREFSFLHRHLGWWCVFFITFHIIFLSWEQLITDQFKCIFLPHENQLLIFYPLITLTLKAPLMLPCVNSYVQKIRRGYERRPKTHAV